MIKVSKCWFTKQLFYHFTQHFAALHQIFMLFIFLKDISQLYQVFPDEILGSGQFGIVYGGKQLNQLSMLVYCDEFYRLLVPFHQISLPFQAFIVKVDEM